MTLWEQHAVIAIFGVLIISIFMKAIEVLMQKTKVISKKKRDKSSPAEIKTKVYEEEVEKLRNGSAKEVSLKNSLPPPVLTLDEVTKILQIIDEYRKLSYLSKKVLLEYLDEKMFEYEGVGSRSNVSSIKDYE